MRYFDQEAEYGGKPCEGPEEESIACEVAKCPIHGEWGDWTEWGKCTQECGPGKHYRSRKIKVFPEFGGEPIKGAKEEEEGCEEKPCPVACEVSDFKDIGECSKRCGGGKMMQVREILTEAAHGGEACPPLEQFVDCNTHLCPIDCVMTDWTDDGPCSLSCGGGLVAQKLYVKVQPQYGGFKCPQRTEREFPCNTQFCPVDGVWGQWSGWSGCSTWCGPGITSRMRNQIVIAAHGGKECEGSEREMKECEDRPCPIYCVFADWDAWGPCSADCGQGETQRTREVAVPAQHGGKVCEGEALEVQECQIAPCPVACEVGPWEMEGECSLTCGGGQQTWTRPINIQALFGGTPCPSSLEKELPCEIQPCPVDCELTDWVKASECSASCGGGIKSEIKNVATQPAHGGAMCDVIRSREVSCNEDPCPIDCEWDAWSGYTMCSTTCDIGETKRTRGKFQEAMHGGKACEGPEEQSEECQVVPCPVHCEFSEWSELSQCDEECGLGMQERDRYETVKEMHGGELCVGPTFETQECE
jgi:hypothetical protein